MANKKTSNVKISEEEEMPETEVTKEFLNFMADELKDIYTSEKHLAKALPKMQKAASDDGLKAAFAGHLVATQVQLERLEQVFELLGETPRLKECEAMDVLVENANTVIDETEKGTPLRDAGLVLAAQKIEHLEIATYSSLVQLARTFGNEDIISLLEENLSEEKEAGELLNILAERSIYGNVASNTTGARMQEGEKAVAVYASVNLTKKNSRKQ